MAAITPERTLMALRKTPVVLNALLKGVTQEQAEQLTDGPGGWMFFREDTQAGFVHLHREEPDVATGNVGCIGSAAIVVLELMWPVAGR